MQQIRLKHLAKKTAIVGVYLLFLLVQLNLRYSSGNCFTNFFSGDVVLNLFASSAPNSFYHQGLQKIQNNDGLVKQSRLNKRYLHEESFTVHSFFVVELPQIIYHAAEANPPTGLFFLRTFTSSVVLRGPPAFISSIYV